MAHEHESLFDHLLREFDIPHPKCLGIKKAVGIGLIILAIIYSFLVVLYPYSFAIPYLKGILPIVSTCLLLFLLQSKRVRIACIVLISFMLLSLAASITYRYLTDQYHVRFSLNPSILLTMQDKAIAFYLVSQGILIIAIIITALIIIIQEEDHVHTFLRCLVLAQLLSLLTRYAYLITGYLLDYYHIYYVIMTYTHYAIYTVVGAGILFQGILAIQQAKGSITATPLGCQFKYTKTNDTAPMGSHQLPSETGLEEPQSPSVSPPQ